MKSLLWPSAVSSSTQPPPGPAFSLAHFLSVRVRDERRQLGRSPPQFKNFLGGLCAEAGGGGAVLFLGLQTICSVPRYPGEGMTGVTDTKHLSCAQQLLWGHQTRLKTLRFAFLLAGGDDIFLILP